MGLREVLSKMKIVEADVHGDQAEPASAGGLDRGHALPPLPPPPPIHGGAAPPISSSLPRSAPAPARSAPAGGDKGGKREGAPAMAEILKAIPELPAIDDQALAQPPGEELPDFAAIYQAAGVVDPAHGYSAAKVFEILSSPDFAGLEPKAKAAALAGFLKMNPTGPVPIADVIQDAVHRDQALDKFEQMLHSRLHTHGEQVERENTALQAEIDALAGRNREKMEANRRAVEAEKSRLARWQGAKRAEERKLAEAVAPFVEKNPITTDPVPDGAPPEAKKTDH
jgi:hypothetical protein